jgi:tetratricopeptide (TPR) repeat protein
VIAQQMGVETSEPEVLIQTLVNQFNQLTAANQEAIDEAESWFNQGFQQDQAGDLDGAIASYDRAVEIKPDLYEAWFNQGNVFSKLERFEEAIASYDKAIEIKPNFQEAWHNRGNALSNLGRLDEASASFEKAKESPAD